MKKVNKENCESWEQQLQSELSSHVSEPPADLWESIAHDIQTAERPRLVHHLHYWPAVAAMIALVALVGELVWQRYSGGNEVAEVNEVSAKIGESSLASYILQQEKSSESNVQILPAGTGPLIAKKKKACTENIQTDEIATATATDETTTVETNENIDEASEQNTTDKVTETPQPVRHNQAFVADNSYPANVNKGRQGRRNSSLNVSLAASGLPAEGAPNQNVSVVASEPGTGFFVGSEGMLKEGSLQQDVYEHHYPLKVGLSLAWQLTERLAVESGVNYTYLHSSVTKLGSGQNAPAASTVNYLGIPVSLSYRIWRNNRFSVSSGIGAEAAKSLRGSQWQFSTALSARVQYDFNNVCGIYLQPSADYYFDNRSEIKTYYSEHPLMPSLQVGLRFNIK